MPDIDLELRRMEIDAEERKQEREAQERREVRRSELFKWVVMLIVVPLGDGLQALNQNRLASHVSEKVDAVAAKADIAASTAAVAAVKATEADKTTANNYAITAKWWAERSGDPQDMAKAEAAAERLEKVAVP